MRFAFLGENGRVDTTHDDDTVTRLPVGAIGLTETQWSDRFNLRLADGVLIHDPVVRPMAEDTPVAGNPIDSGRDHRIDVLQADADTAMTTVSGNALNIAHGRAAAAPRLGPARDETNARLFRQIDAIADAVRRTITGDPLRAAELAQAAVGGPAGENAGYAGAPPSSVDSGVAAKERMAQQINPQVVKSAANDMLSVAMARLQRDQLIDAMQWRIARYQRQTAAATATDDTATAYSALRTCIQALRDAPA